MLTNQFLLFHNEFCFPHDLLLLGPDLVPEIFLHWPWCFPIIVSIPWESVSMEALSLTCLVKDTPTVCHQAHYNHACGLFLSHPCCFWSCCQELAILMYCLPCSWTNIHITNMTMRSIACWLWAGSPICNGIDFRQTSRWYATMLNMSCGSCIKVWCYCIAYIIWFIHTIPTHAIQWHIAHNCVTPCL